VAAAGTVYLAPNQDEDLQGDVFTTLPSVLAVRRPLRVVRVLGSAKPGHVPQVFIHDEDHPPKDGFRWSPADGGDDLVHTGFVTRAMLVSHDCEIAHDERVRLVAMVRPLADLPDAQIRNDVRAGDVSGAFYLPAQEAEPSLEESFVDFRRLTPVAPELLVRGEKVLSLTELMRMRMREHFWLYLCRPFQKARAERDQPAEKS
jgi:hypothetical protein